MNRTILALCLLAGVLHGPPGAVPLHACPATAGARRPAAADAFRIDGAVEHPRDWTVEQLLKELASDVRKVRYTLKGKKAEARCVPLLALVHAAQPRVNPKQKNHLLAFAVIVQAGDGYAVCFSLGELLPEQGKRSVWIAMDRNDKPLPADDGPMRLIVPDEEKPARWIHSISRITILDGAPSSSTPAPQASIAGTRATRPEHAAHARVTAGDT